MTWNRTPACVRSAMLVLLPALIVLGGCGAALRGQWALERAVPNAETFAIDDLRMSKDERFDARVTLDGRTRVESGRYDFKNGKLYLYPDQGGRRMYGATIGANELVLRDGDRKAHLRRVRE